MVCVCGTHWTWGVNQLAEALRNRNKTQIEALLDRSNVNDLMESGGSWVLPADVFLEVMDSSSTSVEIVKFLGKNGARASPFLFSKRLSDAVDADDVKMFTILLELFQGACAVDIYDALHAAITRACKCSTLVRTRQQTTSQSDVKKKLEAAETMALMLIDRFNVSAEELAYSHSPAPKCSYDALSQELRSVLSKSSALASCSLDEVIFESRAAREANIFKQRLRMVKRRRGVVFGLLDDNEWFGDPAAAKLLGSKKTQQLLQRHKQLHRKKGKYCFQAAREEAHEVVPQPARHG